MKNNYGKLIIVKTKNSFNGIKDNIPNDSIVFIKETKEIYTHGTYFGGSVLEIVNNTNDGIVPKFGELNTNNNIINEQNNNWVLTVSKTDGKDGIYWKKLPANAFSAQEYTLPIATSTVLGGILANDVMETFNASTYGNYEVKVDNTGKAFVNVPWKNDNDKVEQVVTSASTFNNYYPILFKYTNEVINNTNSVRFGTNLKYNPIANVIQMGTNGYLKYASGFKISTDGTNFYDILTSNSKINSDTVDGYHIEVTSTPKNNTDTIYLVI